MDELQVRVRGSNTGTAGVLGMGGPTALRGQRASSQRVKGRACPAGHGQCEGWGEKKIQEGTMSIVVFGLRLSHLS